VIRSIQLVIKGNTSTAPELVDAGQETTTTVVHLWYNLTAQASCRSHTGTRVCINNAKVGFFFFFGAWSFSNNRNETEYCVSSVVPDPYNTVVARNNNNLAYPIRIG
jgi:hypothetical protein